MKILKLLIVLVLVINFSKALGQSRRLEYADKLYEQGAYFDAFEAYEDVLARGVDSMDIAEKIAHSYLKSSNDSKALDWYRSLYYHSKISQKDLIELMLLERKFGRYDLSKLLAQEYINKHGSCDVVENILNFDNKAINKKATIQTQQSINSEYSEIGLSFIDAGNAFYSSSKRSKLLANKVDARTNEYFYDIYYSTIDTSNLFLSPDKRMKNRIQSKYHDGPVSYNSTTNYIYFTRNNYINGKKGYDTNKTMRLKIYKAKVIDNKFQEIEELSFNSNDYSNAHPTISRDGSRLYFSSDRSGGFGGMDLYFVRMDQNGNPIGEPENLGKSINTTKDEVFPYFDEKNKLLFFSSEGLGGFGGLDIYYCQFDENYSISGIKNVGNSINSERDDFSVVMDEMLNYGFFSSNRLNGKGGDDFYGFRMDEPLLDHIVLKGLITDLVTLKELDSATVYILNSENEELDSIITRFDGTYEFQVPTTLNKIYYRVQRNGFYETLDSLSITEDVKEYTKNFALMPILDYRYLIKVKDQKTDELISEVDINLIEMKSKSVLNVNFNSMNTTYLSDVVPNKFKDVISYSFRIRKNGYIAQTYIREDTLDKLSVIPVEIGLEKIVIGVTDLGKQINPIYFDYRRWNIRPDAAIELDKIVKIMKDNPEIKIALGSHTDARGKNAENLSLSEKRAQSSVNYIISQGIDRSRITGRGFGETKLKISNKEIEAKVSWEEKEKLHQLNRRTEFIIVK
ncbi:OmpA family protein [Fluviicola taffensis]|uniref:OmpA family protein n=1 Tax=Fluviicola taffensis TaxID=191579 RepID=UPI003137AE7E